MKNSMITIMLVVINLAFIFTSCTKQKPSIKDEDIFKSAVFEEATFEIKGDGDFKKVITKPLVKLDDCKFIVEGTIEFHKDEAVIAVIEFGDGSCDDIATKTIGDVTTEFKLKKLGNKEKYYKIIAEPIVKIEGCDYIVSGVIEFYSKKDDSWLASIDFGDGTCDEWATKAWDGGSKEFSMSNWGPK